MIEPQVAMLPDGKRLHLQHGPIDLIIDAEGPDRVDALRAAARRFDSVLEELVEELPLLRERVGFADLHGATARRMCRATRPHGNADFITPMAAVAGAVADEILTHMTTGHTLTRAYVNNGGDIALHLSPGASFRLAIAGVDGTDNGRIVIRSDDPVRGIATSGRGGRSLSMGIADSVTVLAQTAADADAAATLIANAVMLPDHPSINSASAIEVDPNSDLGDRLVVTECGQLGKSDRAMALNNGAERAERMLRDGLIVGAALMLQGDTRTIGLPALIDHKKVMAHA
ncbi:UPF0280 family protein [Aliiroseovarius sp. YM-037]|uniref:UPF0280 family protein n=1 Tax=Aliiroseovarius sp. YM-037 TaxID=3341728 RepID=UPI003A80BD0C